MEDIKTLLQQQTDEIADKVTVKVREGLVDEVKKGVSDEVKRHIDVIGEDFNSKLQLVAESSAGIQQQLIAIKEMVAKNTENIEIIKSDVFAIKYGLKQKVDLEEFKSLEGRVSLLESRVRA